MRHQEAFLWDICRAECFHSLCTLVNYQTTFADKQSDCVSARLQLNNHCLSNFRSLVGANHSTMGTAVFHLALRRFPVFSVDFIFHCPSVSLLTAAWSLSAVLHQSLLKPHNFMLTLRVTVKIFFLWAIFFCRQKMLKTADTFSVLKVIFKNQYN